MLITVLGAAFALGACSSSGDAGSSGAPSTRAATPVGATTTTTRTATETVAPVASGEPDPAASPSGPGQCLERQLRASIDRRHVPGNLTPDAKGRSRYAVLVDFENTSSSTCTLYGYPGAAIADTDGTQVQQAKRTLRGPLGGLPVDQRSPRTVTLEPGAYAAAFLEGVDTHEAGAAQAGCDGGRYPRILVTPPNTDTAVPFTVGWPHCYSFTVHPVRPLTSP